ncbi:MAG TPA: GNAT family N-acetyltransferase [Polyangia bacterium]|nr:GNAT family N-acetyltransferase [Polyangia bacterium]
MKWVPHHASFVGALRGLLAARGDDRPVTEVFGLTGFAFRLGISAQVELGGELDFPWSRDLPVAVGRLGYECTTIHAPPGHPLRAVLAARAAALIAQAGPAIVWGIHLPAFGLAAADDDPAHVRISGLLDDRGGAQRLPASALGGGEVPVLFVLTLGQRHPIDAQVALADALGEALRLHSALGYATWLCALESGKLDPAGHAHAAQLAAEARDHAAAFLAQARLEGADLAPAADAYSRVAAALGELAERFPFPPARALDDGDLRAAHELVSRARDAELRGLAALEQALRAHRQAAGDRYSVEDARDQDLYFCLADVPLSGLEPAAERCRAAIGPRLGQDFFATIARDRASGAVVGHVYAAPLEASHYPVAAEGNLWFLFCPWVSAPLRGRGLGRRLVDALCAQAHAHGVQGILTETTTLPIFLHEDALAALGFREVARRGETRLHYLALGQEHPVARYLEPPASAALDRVQIRHAYNCPLLLATRAAAAAAARQAGRPVDEADAKGPEAGIVLGAERLANLPAAPDVLLDAIRARR